MAKQQREKSEELVKVLQNLDPRWVKAASIELCSNLTALLTHSAFGEIQQVVIWPSFAAGEPDLSAFVSENLAKYKLFFAHLVGKELKLEALSKQVLNNQRLDAGIAAQNEGEDQCFDSQLAHQTVIIIPGLSFDAHGGRLWHNTEYERLTLNPQLRLAKLIGVCWSLQVSSLADDHFADLVVEWVCHERGFVQTGARFDDDD